MYTLIIYKESDSDTHCYSGYYGSEFAHLQELSYDDLFERLILICYSDLHREDGESTTDEIIIYKDDKLIEELYGNYESTIIKSAQKFAELLNELNEEWTIAEYKREQAQIQEKRKKKQEEKELSEYKRLSEKFKEMHISGEYGVVAEQKTTI